MTPSLVTMVFGSHLYGTDTEQSDHDYKGVVMQPLRDLLLGKTMRSVHTSTKVGSASKNTPQDVETELYSLHYFLHLASEGETVALDMLHAPPLFYVGEVSPVWTNLVTERARFYTCNLKSFVGYARHQAAKYGVKGSRLAEARIAREFLASCMPSDRLVDVWTILPEGEHLHKRSNKVGLLWDVCGKQMTGQSYCHHYLPMLDHFIARYGGRALQAETNQGIDWKAVSHAFRAGYQVLHILRDGGYTYPLEEALQLKQIKAGAIPWLEAGKQLDALLDECEAASQQSTLPERVDTRWIEGWLLDTVRKYWGLG